MIDSPSFSLGRRPVVRAPQWEAPGPGAYNPPTSSFDTVLQKARNSRHVTLGDGRARSPAHSLKFRRQGDSAFPTTRRVGAQSNDHRVGVVEIPGVGEYEVNESDTKTSPRRRAPSPVLDRAERRFQCNTSGYADSEGCHPNALGPGQYVGETAPHRGLAAIPLLSTDRRPRAVAMNTTERFRNDTVQNHIPDGAYCQGVYDYLPAKDALMKEGWGRGFGKIRAAHISKTGRDGPAVGELHSTWTPGPGEYVLPPSDAGRYAGFGERHKAAEPAAGPDVGSYTPHCTRYGARNEVAGQWPQYDLLQLEEPEEEDCVDVRALLERHLPALAEQYPAYLTTQGETTEVRDHLDAWTTTNLGW